MSRIGKQLIALGRRMRRPRGFDGGLWLPDMKAASLADPARTIAPRATLRVPLGEGGPDDATPVVGPGDTVLAGQLIAARQGRGLPVHAPTSGKVLGMTQARLPGRDLIAAIEIRPDGHDRWTDRPAAAEPAGSNGPHGTSAILAAAGIVDSLSREPIHRRLDRRPTAIHTTIISGMQAEPYLSAATRLMADHANEVMAGVEALAAAMGAERAILAVDAVDAGQLTRMRRLCRTRRVAWARLPSKYPQGHPVLLVKSLCGLEPPPGEPPESVGVAVFEVAAAWAAGLAVEHGRPQVSVCLTVSGDGVGRPGTYIAPIGLSISELLADAAIRPDARRLIVGGPMCGSTVSDPETVVTKWMSAVLAMRSEPDSPPSACVRCGWCVEDCPVGLDPSAILETWELQRFDRAADLRPEACIGCGICTYECPSGLPLADGVRATRAMLAHCEKS